MFPPPWYIEIVRRQYTESREVQLRRPGAGAVRGRARPLRRAPGGLRRRRRVPGQERLGQAVAGVVRRGLLARAFNKCGGDEQFTICLEGSMFAIESFFSRRCFEEVGRK